jgi:hypothetical protein
MIEKYIAVKLMAEKIFIAETNLFSIGIKHTPFLVIHTIECCISVLL